MSGATYFVQECPTCGRQLEVTATANLKQTRTAHKALRSRSLSPTCLIGQNNCYRLPTNHVRGFTSHTCDTIVERRKPQRFTPVTRCCADHARAPHM